MKIGFSFFGITYGSGGSSNSIRDIRHCWNNIQSNLISPYQSDENEIKIYLSTYKLNDSNIQNEIINLIKPDKINFSNIVNSDSFTTKYAAFSNFEDDDLDVIFFSRADIHFNKKISDLNIDFVKFNFLFREEEFWNKFKFTTDNFYVWPHNMTSAVKKSFKDTYKAFRSYPDTHGLYSKLVNYISEDNINFISEIHEKSDINSFYTICRPNLSTKTDRFKLINNEVYEKWYK